MAIERHHTLVSGDVVTTSVSGDVVKISGETVKISGDVVAVSGQRMRVDGYYMDSGDWRSLAVNASGEIDVTLASEELAVSGSVTVISGLIDTSVSGDVVKVSGETVVVDGVQVSGEIAKINELASGLVDTSVSGNVVKISGESMVVSGQPVTVSGDIVDTAVPSTVYVVTSGSATSGNPLRISSSGTLLPSQTVDTVIIKTLAANSGDMYIGGNTSGQTINSGFGFLMEAGEGMEIAIDNLEKIKCYATVSGDRVTYMAVD